MQVQLTAFFGGLVLILLGFALFSRVVSSRSDSSINISLLNPIANLKWQLPGILLGIGLLSIFLGGTFLYGSLAGWKPDDYQRMCRYFWH